VELPEQAPPGFAALRRKILEFAAEGEQALLQAAGMRDPGAESALFVVLTETREFPLERPFVREVSTSFFFYFFFLCICLRAVWR
jgi:hypothetical protein